MTLDPVWAVAAILLAEAPHPLSLVQAFELAESHGPDLVDARAAIPIAEAGVEQAGQWPNPTASVSVGSDDPIVFGGLDQRFPVFGQLGTAVAATRAEVGVAEQNVALQRIQVHAEVRRAYFALAAAQAEQRLAEDRLARHKRLVEITAKKLDLGSVSELELEQATLAEHRAEQDVQDKRVAIELAQLRLANVLGAWQLGPLLASDSLTAPAPAPDIEALLPRVASHPEVVLAEREVDAARARAVREGAAIRPTPDVGIEAQDLDCAGNPNNPWPLGACRSGVSTGTGLGLRFSLAFDVPLLSQNRGAIHLAERQAARAHVRAELALARRTAGMRLASANLSAALRRSDFLAQTVVPQAVHVEQLSRVAYEVGRAPLVVVLQAEADVTDVQDQAAAAVAAAQTACADLEEALGATL